MPSGCISTTDTILDENVTACLHGVGRLQVQEDTSDVFLLVHGSEVGRGEPYAKWPGVLS